jgi:hypothetical protein
MELDLLIYSHLQKSGIIDSNEELHHIELETNKA